MTYYVSSGTLNPTHSLNRVSVSDVLLSGFVYVLSACSSLSVISPQLATYVIGRKDCLMNGA